MYFWLATSQSPVSGALIVATASIADVAWVHRTTELLPDVTIRRINGEYDDGGRHHSLSFIVVLGVPPSLYYQKFSA
ncbi:hypothetical protein BJ165DRAFT_1493215 [Panaeolus papilionaceus]|nr:hypothetical protein BJ165DRAFT_1493215 [Panaeolus papilionaceus]